MFTGIVEELGTLASVDPLDRAARLTLKGPGVTTDARHGDSICVNGVCLTVVDVTGEAFTADVMAETLDRSALGALTAGDPVNLERAATLGTRLGGHLVQGHVDGVGTVLDRRPDTHWEVVRISLPSSVSRYVVEKGSIAVDGVSLTVTTVGPVGPATDSYFEVSLIPTTLAATTLGIRPVGSRVNLEVDVIAKYVERLLPTQEVRS